MEINQQERQGLLSCLGTSKNPLNNESILSWITDEF